MTSSVIPSLSLKGAITMCMVLLLSLDTSKAIG
jgi:hypothetical protein